MACDQIQRAGPLVRSDGLRVRVNSAGADRVAMGQKRPTAVFAAGREKTAAKFYHAARNSLNQIGLS